MPIQIYWDNEEKTILMEAFVGQWTIEDYRKLVDEAANLLAQVSHPVHVIVDGTQSEMPPTQILTGMHYAIKKMPPNQGVTVFVKLNRVMVMFVDVARQVSPRLARNTYFVDTVEEARRLIADKGSTFKTGGE